MNPSIHTAQVLPARGVLFLGIVAFHVLLIYAFASGLIRPRVEFLKQRPPVTVYPDPPQPPQKTDETPTFSPERYTAEVVEPLEPPPVNLPTDGTDITLPIGPSTGPVSVAPVQPAPPPIRLLGRNVLPNTDNYYPASEIRASHEGSAEVQSCVDVNGRLDGTPTIQASSGRVPLDNAAVRL